MQFHTELNPVLWDLTTEDLIPEVKEKLEEIAEAFIEFLEIPTDAVLDKVITGSSASYNYNEFSDLDLHVIVDFEKVHEDCPLVSGYLNSLKKQFNDNHDIFIHGVPVELYAEQKDQGTVHNGLYSLNTGWIDKPQKIEPTDNDAAVEAKYNEIKEMVDKCDDSEEATELLEKIYTMRKAGLAEAGEFCTENLAFKKLRNEGCMDKLRQIKKEQIDKQLSLESYREAYHCSIQNRPSIQRIQDALNAYKPVFEITKGYDPHLYKFSCSEKDWKEVYHILKELNCEKLNWNPSLYPGCKGVFKFIYPYDMEEQIDRQLSLESYNESLQNEYKQAFDLLIQGENIVGTLDTDFGKQFVKDVENLYKLKSYKMKLSVAKEMLKDIQGYLIDEQYDSYNAKIDKFLNNSKNESIKEEINMETKLSEYLTQNGFQEEMAGDQLKLVKELDNKKIEVVFWNDVIIVEYMEDNKRIGARKLDISDDLKLQKAIDVILVDPNTKKQFIESLEWRICRDMEKGHFYICTDSEVYEDQFGEPYHFDTLEEAEEFLQELNEDVNTLEKKIDDVDTTLKDLMDKINGMSEGIEISEFNLDKAYSLIDEALKED